MIFINVISICCMCLFSIVFSDQSFQVEKYQLTEIELKSQKVYSHPIKDVTLSAQFMGPNGQSYSIRGFWNGDSNWCIRFAPPLTGNWVYITICSDTLNQDLHKQVGSIHVDYYTGNDPYRKKGWIKTSDNGQYLTYENEDPFFWLGCTAWEITWKSYWNQVCQYLSDRKNKGFNVIQVVAMSHQIFNVQNRNGDYFFLNNDKSMLNPKYLNYLDSIVFAANDSGIAVALVPLWAYFSEAHKDSSHFPWGPIWNALNEEEASLLANYIGARYAGSNIVWIVGGDNFYNTPERITFWTQFADSLRHASGDSIHLTTLHRGGGENSYNAFDNTTEWLDFQMYQSGHVANSVFPRQLAQEGCAFSPSKPVLNGEPVYEGIFNCFWKYTDAFKEIDTTQTFRIKAEHVRQAAYESILYGARVGITYGANGVWQWHTEELPGSHDPHVEVDSAWKFPGSQHMSILKDILIPLKWFQAYPIERVQNVIPDTHFVTMATNNDYIICYVPVNTSSFTISNSRLKTARTYLWIDPSTGDSTEIDSLQTIDTLFTFVPPDTNDWLLLVELNQDIAIEKYVSRKTSFFISATPNPCKYSTLIKYNVGQFKKGELGIYNIKGDCVYYKEIKKNGMFKFNTQKLPNGIYFGYIKAGKKSNNFKFTVLK